MSEIVGKQGMFKRCVACVRVELEANGEPIVLILEPEELDRFAAALDAAAAECEKMQRERPILARSN